MFYGSLKFKRSFFGKIKWYAKFKINNEIIWVKVSLKEIQKLLDDNGGRYLMICTDLEEKPEYTEKYKMSVYFGEGEVKMMQSGKFPLFFPFRCYKSATFKLVK